MDTPRSVWIRFEGRQQPALLVSVTARGSASILYLREGYGIDSALVLEGDTRPLERKGEPYPVKRHVRHLKRIAKHDNITKRAKALLAELTDG